MPRKPAPDLVVPEKDTIKGLPHSLASDPKYKVIVLGRQIRIGRYAKDVNGKNQILLHGYVVDGRYYALETYREKFDRFGKPRAAMVETGPARNRVRKQQPAPEPTPLPQAQSTEPTVTASAETTETPVKRKRPGKPGRTIVGAEPEAGVSYQFKQMADGRYKVTKVWSRYDNILKNNHAYKAQVIGISAVKYDITHLEPTKAMLKKQEQEALLALRKAAKSAISGAPVSDAQSQPQAAAQPQPQRPVIVERKYPLDILAIVAIAAFMTGVNTCQGIATFWANHRKYWESIFPDFPPYDISHDTVKRCIERLGLEDGKPFLAHFLSQNIQGRLDAIGATLRLWHLDGQMVRASTNEDGRAPDILNVYDSTLGIIVSHELVGAKTNEIPHCLSVVRSLNLSNCILTCDALNTQKGFAQVLIQEGADYCMAVKGNHSAEEQDIRAVFNAEPTDSTDLKIYDSDWELGHGRLERRIVRVLPARRMSANLRSQWPGLEDGKGCIVEVTTYSEIKRNGNKQADNLEMSGPPEKQKKIKKKDTDSRITRYFFTTLLYDSDDVETVLAHLIRRHWAVEVAHWGYDVVFGQDKLHCKSGPLTMGFSTLTKIADYYVNQLKSEGRRLGLPEQQLTRPELQNTYSTAEQTIPALCRLFHADRVAGKSQGAKP